MYSAIHPQQQLLKLLLLLLGGLRLGVQTTCFIERLQSALILLLILEDLHLAREGVA